MKATELFALLKAEAAKLSDQIPCPDLTLPDDQKAGTPEYINACLTRYNYAAFRELMDTDPPIDCGEIDDEFIQNFSRHIDAYMDKHAPDQPVLKSYIRTMALYLTCIARKPLHPPDMVMPEIYRTTSPNGLFFCAGEEPGQNQQDSLCLFCVAYSKHQ